MNRNTPRDRPSSGITAQQTKAAVLAATLALLGGCAPAAPQPIAAPLVPPCVQGFPLFIAVGEHEVEPGAVDTLRLREHRGPYGPAELAAGCDPTWSTSAEAPATIARETGVLQVNADAPDGTVFTVSAQLEDEVVEGMVRVVDPALNPLVGQWTQVSSTPCSTGRAESPGNEPVRELVFHANRRFTVTWQPFERYVDYWGTYSFDLESGELRLEIEGANFTPERMDLEGRAQIENGELRLVDMSLGSRHPGSSTLCEATFR